jgi:hypothetical protein
LLGVGARVKEEVICAPAEEPVSEGLLVRLAVHLGRLVAAELEAVGKACWGKESVGGGLLAMDDLVEHERKA